MLKREEKTFTGIYKCRCCNEQVFQTLYVPQTVREFRSTTVRELPLWEMYQYLDKTVPKIRLDDCPCTNRGRTVQELICIVENEEK